MGIRTFNKEINGLQISAAFDERDIHDVFLPLLNRLTQMQRRKGRRVIVCLAAPPGCGKSTLAAFLEELSVKTQGITPVQAAGMDGFHHYGAYLKTHTVTRDGREILMDEIKGAPITFDVPRLQAYIERALNEDVIWPVYSRTKHDVAEGGFLLHEKIIVLEGNYLLLPEEPWKGLRGLFDYTIFLSAAMETLKKRLIQRKIDSGYPKEDAKSFYDFSDGRNAALVLAERPEADLLLEYKDGRYRKTGGLVL